MCLKSIFEENPLYYTNRAHHETAPLSILPDHSGKLASDSGKITFINTSKYHIFLPWKWIETSAAVKCDNCTQVCVFIYLYPCYLMEAFFPLSLFLPQTN